MATSDLGVEEIGPDFVTSLLSGAMAGLSVDLLFYPIDTVKTRLQSAQGFWKSGGFNGVYRGMGSVAVGSAPGASVFFVTYETLKAQLSKALYPERASSAVGESPAVHMMAGTAAEISACMIRVPTEVVKSRQQTSAYGRVSTFRALQLAASDEGIRGLYRGFFSTVLREIPFTCIQFPLFEFLKRQMANHTRTLSGAPRQDAAWWQSALSGSIAGSIAAALTTPLDVIKTRIMLARARSESASTVLDAARAKQDTRILTILRTVVQQGGVRGLFAGVVPRTMWIGLGGAVFLGTFDAAAKTLQLTPAVKSAEVLRT